MFLVHSGLLNNIINYIIMITSKSVFEWIVFVIWISMLFLIYLMYSVIFLVRYGATIGLIIFGLKVVDQNDKSINYKLAAKRTILLFLFVGGSFPDKKLNLRVVKRGSLADY